MKTILSEKEENKIQKWLEGKRKKDSVILASDLNEIFPEKDGREMLNIMTNLEEREILKRFYFISKNGERLEVYKKILDIPNQYELEDGTKIESIKYTYVGYKHK